MKMEIFSEVAGNKGPYKNRECDYFCLECDIGFHVIMFNIYHVKNNLILNKNGGTRC